MLEKFCDQLAYFLDTLRSRCRVRSSLPQFILNASCLLELPYKRQNWRIWQHGHTIRKFRMKCLFHTMIRARSTISFQHKNLFLCKHVPQKTYVSFRNTTLRTPNIPYTASWVHSSRGLLCRIEEEPVQPHRVFGTLFVASLASAGTLFFHLLDLCLILYKKVSGHTCKIFK